MVLTSFEYLILEYLMRNARQVVPSSSCWTSSMATARGPQHHRGDGEPAAQEAGSEGTIQPISTIRRQGYIFNLSCN